MSHLPPPRPTPLPRSNFAQRLGEFPDFTFAGDTAFAHRQKWADFFRRRIGPGFDGRIILEIGCFDAAFLCRIAASHPNTAFIGLDWKCKPLYDGAQRVTQLGLNNVALLRARAQDILQIFAEGEVNEIWLFHPEPLQATSGLNSRLVDAALLSDIHRILGSVSSLMAFKTDQPEYFQWLLSLCATEAIRNRFDIATASSDYWNEPAAIASTSSRCFSNEVTTYESRFIKKRLPIYYVELRKTPTDVPARMI